MHYVRAIDPKDINRFIPRCETDPFQSVLSPARETVHKASDSVYYGREYVTAPFTRNLEHNIIIIATCLVVPVVVGAPGSETEFVRRRERVSDMDEERSHAKSHLKLKSDILCSPNAVQESSRNVSRNAPRQSRERAPQFQTYIKYITSISYI